MSIQTLAPNQLISSSGMWSCVLSDLTSDLDSPDANYCDAYNDTYDTDLLVGFATPAYAPRTGSNLQKFRVEYKRTGDLFSSPFVTIKIALRETGSSTDLASTLVYVVNDLDSHVLTLSWDAALLGTASGAAVECFVDVTHITTGSKDASADVGGIEWLEDYIGDDTGDIALTVPKPSVTASGSYTPPQPLYAADIAFTVPRPGVSALAAFTQAQYAADIAFTVPRPNLFAAAEFQPVAGSTGNTGWMKPSTISIHSDTGVTVSNVSNMAQESAAFASVNLQVSGGDSVQASKSLVWDWVDPGDYPAGAILEGIEIVLYAQYDTANHDGGHQPTAYNLWIGADGPIESSNLTNNLFAIDQEDSPLYSNALHWGGETSMFGYAVGTLVADFLDYDRPLSGGHTLLKLYDAYGGGRIVDQTATIKMAFIKLKVWWSIPNYVDIAATPSFSVGVDDSAAPLQKICDISADIAAGMTVSIPRVTGNPYTVYADANFSMIIDPPTISEGTLYTDMACWMDMAVDFDANVIRLRDMYANVDFDVDSTVYVGYSNPLFSNFTVSVLMDPQLHRDVEMQTDALATWFDITMDVNGLVGTMALVTDIPISVTMGADGMVVNWALYAAAQFSVTATPYIASMTNISSDLEIEVTMYPQLQSIINMYADFVMDGLLLNSAFVRLPVPAPEERTMYMQPKGRDMKMKPKGRKIILTRN